MTDYIKREDAVFVALQQPFFQNSMATEIRQIPGIDLADYVPKDFHDKTCEAMAKRHQEEIADILERTDADRPQGEWKPFDLTWGRNIYACSICEEAIAVPCGWSDGKPIYDYCPMCGARMKGADDE